MKSIKNTIDASKPANKPHGLPCRTHVRGGVNTCFTRKTGDQVFKICNPGEPSFSVTRVS